MRVFVSGGADSGKSAFAERAAIALRDKSGTGASLYYIATLAPLFEEDFARISRHVKARARGGFQTIEAHRDIRRILCECDTNGTFLIDSVTTLLANEMFDNGRGDVCENAHKKVAEELESVFKAVKNVVAVSDYIYSNAEFYDEGDCATRRFIKGLSFVDRRLAELSDVAAEVFCGEILYYKGCEKV